MPPKRASSSPNGVSLISMLLSPGSVKLEQRPAASGGSTDGESVPLEEDLPSMGHAKSGDVPVSSSTCGATPKSQPTIQPTGPPEGPPPSASKGRPKGQPNVQPKSDPKPKNPPKSKSKAKSQAKSEPKSKGKAPVPAAPVVPPVSGPATGGVPKAKAMSPVVSPASGTAAGVSMDDDTLFYKLSAEDRAILIGAASAKDVPVKLRNKVYAALNRFVGSKRVSKVVATKWEKATEAGNDAKID